MTAFINPRSSELNHVVVAGIQSPGRARLTDVKATYHWDVKQSFGRSGATTTFRGRGIAKPTLYIDLWELEHFIAWPLFAALLEPPSMVKPLVVEMRHPRLSAAGITAVGVEELGQPERQPNGIWTATIKLIEYRPSLPALVKPKGAIPSAEKGVPVTPKTEADIALAQANADFSAARAAAR
ncbi:MAG: hypothetical protein KF764_08600 [Labilithrix sp.]|nr:hypothetical protein [Labilithrix sp.]